MILGWARAVCRKAKDYSIGGACDFLEPVVLCNKRRANNIPEDHFLSQVEWMGCSVLADIKQWLRQKE